MNANPRPLRLPTRRLLSSLAAFSLLAAPVAQAAPTTLVLNGQSVTLNTTVIGGVTYLKLADLKAVLAAQGGANAKASVEGCVNEWLFNGIERLRVTKVQAVKDQYYGDGWGVTVEIKNGAQETLTLDDAGIEYNGAVSLAFADGNSWSKSWREGWQSKTYAKMQQGTGTLYEFQIFPESKMDPAAVATYTPQKFLLEVGAKNAERVKANFSVPDPSFRVNLTCRK
ncbi:hypothetical protein [Deinococcus sp. Leaf326]|jgi:hypothetical protein|uniref:hypothetical protein n=1 Tax=Deinococcus sp. Leaf326 TaxID=1736338 RepID=UPI0006FB49C3|nr:hypothetical protein [Deinococcus sp. Leaf326]KQR01016.1 hypothetical protein ASF71_12690 [Deinococcus sp. Leaf326]